MSSRHPRRTRSFGTLLVVALALAGISGCGEDQTAEPADLGNLPDLTGKLLGPQPGPDRHIPQKQNPYPMDRTVLTEGRRLFVWFNCYGCHGGRGGGGMGPSLRDATWLYGNSQAAIYNSIAEGRPLGMPAWGTKLPEEQIWKITAYVKSMGTAKEPAPPPANPVFPNPPPRRDVKGVQAGGGP